LSLGTAEEKKQGIRWLNLLGVVLFSLFTAYDIQVLKLHARRCRSGKNNSFKPDYPVETLGIYLDFINLFVNMDSDD
jgi:FtsH-binding integral membrane protein